MPLSSVQLNSELLVSYTDSGMEPKTIIQSSLLQDARFLSVAILLNLVLLSVTCSLLVVPMITSSLALMLTGSVLKGEEERFVEFVYRDTSSLLHLQYVCHTITALGGSHTSFSYSALSSK